MSLKNKEKKPINFDNFTSNYENKISKSFGYIDDNVSYYHEAKSIIAKNEIGYNPNKILDFGCGIGSMLKFLKKNFNNSKFYAYDESLKSLEHVKINYSDVSCLNDLDTSEKFDLIFVSNVIHHVKSKDRYSFFQKIYKLR